MAAICIESEYGTLKEVCVGIGIARVPNFRALEWGETCLQVLPEHEAKVMRDNSGKHFRDLGKYDALEAENNALIEVLEKFGVKVHRPVEVTDEIVKATYGAEWLHVGYTQGFARDCMFVVGDNVIELSPGAPFRRCDLLGYRDFFNSRLPGSGARWFAMPAPDITRMIKPGYTKEDGLCLEGGDLFVLKGKTILCGQSQNTALGSSRGGIEWLQSTLGPQGYEVKAVVLRPDFLHLDCCLSVPREGLAIVCEEAFVDGLPSEFDGWDLIKVSADSARLLATNGLPLDPANFILGYNDQEDGLVVKKALEERGITVHAIFFGSHNEDGGGIRCATHGLFRE